MEQKEKLLERVRKLIAQADGEEDLGNTAAAQTFREKADQLMTLYAIEAFELEFATEPKARHYKPEFREYVYGEVPSEIENQLSSLFWSLAEHCRVKIGWYGYKKSKIVGYPQDLDYLDILFTGVRMHMSANVRPTARRDLGYEACLALLKESGMKWQSIYEQLVHIFPERFDRALASHRSNVAAYERQYQSWQNTYERNPDYTTFEQSYHFENYYMRIGDLVFTKVMPRPVGVRFTKEYTTFCQETGRQRIYSDPQVWLRSFVDGYVDEIRSRLYKMQQASAGATTGKEMVLAGIEGDLKEFFYECFPDQRPHAANCDCDSCHWCSNPKCTRRNCSARRKPIRYASVREQAVSHTARSRGRQAGAQADLSGLNNRVGGKVKKELG